MVDKVRVCWLSGNLHERKLVLEKIKNQFAGYDIHIFDDQYSYAYVEQQIFTSGCFSSKRLIVLNTLPISSGTKQTMINHLKKVIDDVPEDCVLVFNGIDSEPLKKQVEKVGKVFSFENVVKKTDAPYWVMQQFKDKGKSITDTDAKAFVELNGFDSEVKGIGVDVLSIAIDKVSIYSGRRKNILTEDIVINAFPSEDFIIWSIFDAMDTKVLENCLTVFNQMPQSDGTDATSILYLILWRYRLLFFLKETLAKGLTKPQVMALAKNMIKLRQTGETFKMSLSPDIDGENSTKPAYTDYWIGRELNGQYGRPAIDIYSRKELVNILSFIHYAILESRVRTTESSKELLLDVLMLIVCNKITDIQLDKLKDSHGE